MTKSIPKCLSVLNISSKFTPQRFFSCLASSAISLADGSSDLEGTINATSLEDMPGGVDKKVCFDVETGSFTGYGTKIECAS